jgi:hypothetical protein
MIASCVIGLYIEQDWFRRKRKMDDKPFIEFLYLDHVARFIAETRPLVWPKELDLREIDSLAQLVWLRLSGVTAREIAYRYGRRPEFIHWGLNRFLRLTNTSPQKWKKDYPAAVNRYHAALMAYNKDKNSVDTGKEHT